MSEAALLKPCPFCGDERVILCNHRGFPRFECVMCNARGPMMSTDDNARALSDWNLRHHPEPTEAEIERVAKAISQVIAFEITSAPNPGARACNSMARAAIAAMRGS